MTSPQPVTASPQTVVLGAGLAGLSAAHHLLRQGLSVDVLDQAEVAGGMIGTVEQDGFRFEIGPHTVPADAPTLFGMIEALGLESRVLGSLPQARHRFIWRAGRLHAAPTSPPALLRSGLLGWRAKLRMLGEPWARSAEHPEQESLAAFFARRFGPASVDALADPVCAGVYAGRPQELGVDAFAKMRVWEQEHGSLLRAALKLARQARRNGSTTRRGLFSFPRGLQELTDAAAAELGGRLRLSHRVDRLERIERRWRIQGRHLADPATPFTLETDRLVVALPGPAAAELLEGLVPAAAACLQAIPYASVAVVGFGVERSAVRHSLDGFGMLRCRDSPLPGCDPILGVLFSSSIFEGRAPEGGALLEVMVGGTDDAAALDLSDEMLIERAAQACRITLGLQGAPRSTSIVRWQRAIPQYLPGHLARMQEVKRQVADLGGLRLAGNYLDGVGLEAVARSGFDAVALEE